METLNIPATKNTPGVSYEPQQGRFLASGNSIPENASDFYRPIMEWLTRNIAELTANSLFEFNLPYFNSSSLKAIYLLLMEIKEGQMKGKPFRVVWYAEEEDEFMNEAAETFIELTGMPIEVRTGVPAE